MAAQPLMTPTFEALSFMTQGGGQSLPGANIVEEVAQEQRSGARQNASRKGAIARQTRFLEAMSKFCAETKDPKLINFDIRGERSGWSAVMSQAEAALQQYESKRKGFKGLLRHMDVAIGDAGEQIEPFLDLLPCGEYTSVVCGGVKLIFAAFKRKAEARDTVMKTLGEAPEYLEQAESFLALYYPDEELYRLVDELYVELLAAVESVIGWLSSKMQRFHSYFPATNLSETRNRVDDCRKRVIARAEDCNRFVNVQSKELTRTVLTNIIMLAQESRENSKENKELLNELIRANKTFLDLYTLEQKQRLRRDAETRAEQRMVQERMGQSLDEIKQDLSTTNQDLSASNFHLTALLTAAQQKADLQEKSLQASKEMSSSLVVENQLLVDELSALRRSQRTPVPQYVVVREVIEAQQLIHWLAAPGASSIFDATAGVRQTSGLDVGRRLSNVVTRSPRLLSWLTSMSSSMLFVEPVGSIANYSVGSPGSFVTASIAHALDDQNYALVLKHFCAQSQYKTRNVDRVSDVLAGLITQLLSLYPFDLAAWTTSSTFQYSILLHRDLAEERDLRYLCQLLEYLVTSLRFNTAFILIDDFYLLERSAEDASLEEMFYTFRQIMTVSSALKVLCMTPEESDRHGPISGRISETNKLKFDLADIERGGSGVIRTQTRTQHIPLSVFVDDD